MHFTIKAGIWFLVVITITIAQDAVSFRVVSIDGTARVQRSEQRSWEKVGLGDNLFDNDLVETYFQTKLIMLFGVNNVVILGSNSKALLNITEKKDGDRTITDINLTLFNGGIFSKAISNCKVNIYTAHAVGTMDSGSVTTVAEGKTGETGFQVLGGSIYVRNIAQQKGIDLRSGLTTMIQPGKEPTAPLYITHRHVSVLQHYFGEEYIISEMDASGIKPTDERGSGGGGGYNAFSTKPREYVDEGMYRSIFSLNKIYGSILDDRERNSLFYHAVKRTSTAGEKGMTVMFEGGAGIAGEGVSPLIRPSFSFRKGKFDVGVRLSFVGTPAGFSSGFTSLGGILDKVDHLAFGTAADAWSLYAGTLHGITFGDGLVVDHFTNLSPNNAFSPLGVHGQVRIFDHLTVQAFTASVTAPYVNGIYALYEPSNYHVGIGYAADFNQYTAMVAQEDMRYAALPQSDTLFPVLHDGNAVHCYLFDASADIVDRENIRLRVTAEFAQKLFGGLDGFVARVPSLKIDIKKVSFGGGVVVESGKLLSGQFDGSYMENRYRVKSDLRTGFIDSVVTPNNRLARERQTFGFSLCYKMNPLRGMDVDVYYKQDVIGRRTVEEYSIDSTLSRDLPGDFSYRLRLAVNDTLVRVIQHGELLLQQSHGRLFPVEGVPFAGWTFDGSVNCSFIPFFFGISFEIGASFFYIESDLPRDMLTTGNDFGVEIRAGARKDL
ncbi:MAG: hypothetical protein JW863_14445 [Chitinispirillaceae bacterium]|nr:hypothetical protein [Chitinispirillaceae bacterium]